MFCRWCDFLNRHTATRFACWHRVIFFACSGCMEGLIIVEEWSDLLTRLSDLFPGRSLVRASVFSDIDIASSGPRTRVVSLRKIRNRGLVFSWDADSQKWSANFWSDLPDLETSHRMTEILCIMAMCESNWQTHTYPTIKLHNLSWTR